MKISSGQWQRLLDQLKNNDSKLVDLNLSHRELTDSDAIELVNACKANTVLKKLYLGENHIGSEGLKALAKMLETNDTLICLRLSGNEINNISAQFFIKALEHNPTITSLAIHPKKIGAVNPSIFDAIKTLLDDNNWIYGIRSFKCLLRSLKCNHSTFTTIDISPIDRFNVYRYKETLMTEFKKAVSENVYIRKLIFQPDNISMLEFFPIETYQYIQEIEIKEPHIRGQMIEHAMVIIKQIISALDSNKNLIRINFPECLFQYGKDKEQIVAKKIQRNYQNYIANKKELICSLIVIAQGLRDKPLGGMPHDLLFYLLSYVFADNVAYQQMTRKKMFASFFNGVYKSAEDIRTIKSTVDISAEIKSSL